MTEAPYRIVSLEVENFMRLDAVFIEPSGNLIEITGKNGAGKSSVLNAIWAALEGAKAIHAEPIKRGANTAVIRLDLGSVKVTRRFARKENEGRVSFPTSIVVETAEGARFPSPQATLNALIGAFSFNPMALFSMAPKEQFDALAAFVPDVDFAAIDKANAEDFDARTVLNRGEKALRARIDAVVVPADAPAARIDTNALIAELERAGERNTEIQREVARRESIAAAAKSDTAAAAEARRRAAGLREQARRLIEEATAIEKGADTKEASARDLTLQIEALPPVEPQVATGEIRHRIAAADAANRLFDDAAAARASVASLTADAEKHAAESARLTKAIEERTGGKEAKIAAAKMPVDGLAFGEGVVLLNGLPFDQASKAERIRVSVALAAAANPKLKIAFVEDGSLLDEDSWAALAATAQEFGAQVFAETVSSRRAGAIVIEDGHVKAYAEAAE